jgi:hypothetical protein
MTLSTRLTLVPTKTGHDVICSVKHPVSTSFKYSLWYISAVTFFVNDEVAAEFKLGPHVSPDPVIGTHIAGLSFGDRVSIEWVDTRAGRGSAEAFVQ